MVITDRKRQHGNPDSTRRRDNRKTGAGLHPLIAHPNGTRQLPGYHRRQTTFPNRNTDRGGRQNTIPFGNNDLVLAFNCFRFVRGGVHGCIQRRFSIGKGACRALFYEKSNKYSVNAEVAARY